MNFAPRAVPPSSWRHWFVEAMALTTRRLGAFIALGIAGVLLHAVPAMVGFGVAAVPLVFGLGCVIAECSDQGRPVLAALATRSKRAYARLALAGIVFGVGTWVIGVLVVWVMRSLEIDPLAVPLPGAASSRSLAEALGAGWLVSAGVTLFGLCVLLGFLVPLLACGELPALQAFGQTMAAIRLNPFAVIATAALACTAVVGLLTSFLAIPWTAIVSAILYVAYRDVFLGQRENAPVRALHGAVTAEPG